MLDEYTCMKDLALKENENIAVHTQTGTLGYLFLGKIMQMPVCSWTFLLKIGAPNHPGKGLDPPPQTGNAQMNRDFLSVGLPLYL